MQTFKLSERLYSILDQISSKKIDSTKTFTGKEFIIHPTFVFLSPIII